MKNLAATSLGIGLVLLLVESAAGGMPGPRKYYLALGDSIAYGIQPDKVDAGLPPSGFRTGYVDDFASRLQALRPSIAVVNYGCPGESTITFTRGGCPWSAEGKKLHNPFRGSQMKAALAFLAAHPHEVSPITLNLWANDVSAFAERCGSSLVCLQRGAAAALFAFGNRLGSILGSLRAAAPDAEIIVTGAFNEDVDRLATTNPLYRALNQTIRRTVAAHRARFANILPVFNPPGSIARERARICSLTFQCSRNDGHPTDAGYRAIASVVFAASGYRR